MFNKILVPLDGTPESAVALPLARTVARATGGEIVLVQVVPSTPGTAREAEGARAYLERIVHELAADGPPVTTAVPAGDAATEILHEVSSRAVDLVVMATHGRVGLGRALLGSVAERVLARSPVPVFMLRPGGHRVERLQRLLVPVDGTPGSALAISVARALALETKAELVLSQVVVPLPRFAEGVYIDPDWEEDTRLAAQRYVDQLAGALRKVGVTAEGRAKIGQVAPALAALADEADVDAIVMSTHALTGAIRSFLGSVADEVVRTARRPVLLVRQAPARLAEAGRTEETISRAQEEVSDRL